MKVTVRDANRAPIIQRYSTDKIIKESFVVRHRVPEDYASLSGFRAATTFSVIIYVLATSEEVIHPEARAKASKLLHHPSSR